MTPGIYLLEVSACIGIFYVLYQVCFNGNTFFGANRSYLLAGLILSFLIPDLQFEFAPNVFHRLAPAGMQEIAGASAHDYGPAWPATAPGGNEGFSLLAMLYYAGVIIMGMRFLHSIYRICCAWRGSRVEMTDGFKALRADVSQPFSCFNMIFLPDRDVDPMIVDHEKIHVKQCHWVDLVIVELAAIVLWFNPLMLFYRREVKAQHEYLADAGAIRGGVPVDEYLCSILREVRRENRYGFVNKFYSQPIKKRVMMITRNKTSFKFFAAYLFCIPVVSLLLFAFANRPAPVPMRNGNVGIERIIIVDPGHGGGDVGARASRGMSEKELTLSIAHKMVQLGQKSGVKVILTRSHDEERSLGDRASYADRYSADLFISLHVNFDNDPLKSGLDFIFSESNAKAEKSKLLAEELLAGLKPVNGIDINGIKKGNAYVLKNNTVPAVALELGYLSNKKDSEFINKAENQRLISERILSSAVNFLK